MNKRSSPAKVSVAATVLIGALAAPTATAGIGKGNWEFGFGLGTTEFDSEVAGDSGSYLDLRGGYFLTDRFQFEGQLSNASTDEGNIDINLSSLFVNAVINSRPGKRARPYVLFGAGHTTLEADGAFTADDDSLSYQMALGCRFFLGSTGKMAWRVELSTISEETFEERSTHYSVTTGFSWRIGPDVSTWRRYRRAH